MQNKINKSMPDQFVLVELYPTPLSYKFSKYLASISLRRSIPCLSSNSLCANDQSAGSAVDSTSNHHHQRLLKLSTKYAKTKQKNNQICSQLKKQHTSFQTLQKSNILV